MAVRIDQNSFTTNVVQKNVFDTSTKMVDSQMQMDNMCPELLDYLKMGGATLPTVSGLNVRNYPGVAELNVSLHSLSQLSVAKRTPLPPELVEQFTYIQSYCQMGLFPEIGRAWLTIDSNIFIWSFHDGSDLAYYDGLKETIICVGLVKPKPNVFQSFIHCLLCLTTKTEIIVLGINFTKQSEDSSPFAEMHMLPDPLFTYPTDNIDMCSFEGTENGRIFLGGKDGSIYEFVYQAQDGWFSGKCKTINHSSSVLHFLIPDIVNKVFGDPDIVVQIAIDNSRHILYARFAKSTIQVFDLGKDGKDMRKVCQLTQNDILLQACDVARTIDKKNFLSIVHIHPIEATESKFVHLLAVTQSGVRLYYTTNSGFGDRPHTMSLLHVRLPPGFTANTAVSGPLNVHTAYYKKGFALLASSQSEDRDIVFATSSDSFAFYPELIETHSTLSLDGRTWSLAEVPVNFPIVSPENISDITLDPPLLVTQHRDPARHFVFINSQGCCILRKPRPVDQLYKLLVDNKGPDSDVVRSFFDIHKVSQACAMCLILACSPHLKDKQVSEWANRAFFMYGGEPQVSTSIQPMRDTATNLPESSLAHQYSPVSSTPVWASTPQNQQRLQGALPQPQFSTIYSPVRAPNNQSSIIHQSPVEPLPFLSSTSPATSEIIFSGKHNALYLYFSRIIRSLWNKKLVIIDSKNLPDSQSNFIIKFESNISNEDMFFILQQLSAFKQFLNSNESIILQTNVNSIKASQNPNVTRIISHNVQNSPASAVQSNFMRKSQSDAELQERVSLVNFMQLVNYAYEVLALWKILCHHHFEKVVAFLTPVQQDLLKVLTFKEFIVDGKELSINLANALINFYLEDSASTGTIIQRLREFCPSIYKIEDATASKAREIVLKAKHIVNKTEKEHELLEALKLCKSIAPNLDLEQMSYHFREAQFYHGIIDLCLCCAEKIDPQGLALYYYKNGESQDDVAGNRAFTLRMNCYKYVIEAMSNLISLSNTQLHSPTIPKSPGAPASRDPNKLTPEEAKLYSDLILETSLKANDELFHVALYNWLTENNETKVLLSIKSHFLEDYLKRCSHLRPDNMYMLNLLRKYYEKNQNFSAAARILAKLADKEGVEMNLPQRIEYLSRAIMCIKGSEMRISSSGEGEFLHELKEKMEVACIQQQILVALQNKKNKLRPNQIHASFDEAINILNSNFLDIQQLYEDYAVNFDLAECQLALIECGGLYDPVLIESLWQNIIEKELIATVGNMPDTRVKILHDRLMVISKPYVSSEKYFPVYFVIKFLECKTCTMGLEQSWIFKVMLSLGVSVVDLLKIYHKMQESRDSCWAAAGQPLHLMGVLVKLIGYFADSPSAVSITERRSFATFCLDVISGYLVDLKAMGSSIPLVSDYIKDFKAVQKKLEMLP